ncbi:PhzF family phenazine biosynthesis protein [Catellatospora methionotrophica]|uniref:PhzF family phenazine biosynthesis protein n=1 Tax=Catellatospora methionotrophica TaxID=121620 RepID=UPI00140CDAAA|nr:PhzF family phenazine biosynthesis protein [Catellatospora methionotrophica]
MTAWWGRVFADGLLGGNHTVVILGPTAGLDHAVIAARLAVPDTAYVTSTGSGEIVLRTFSPVEELAQCLQTSLAALSALGVADGQRRLVRHGGGEPMEVHREGTLTWARELSGGPDPVPTSWPGFVRAEPAPGTQPLLLRQARSRIHLRCADSAQLESLDIAPEQVLTLCARTGANGLVLESTADDGSQRVRVFTTSLSGREDNATGGAVLGVGRIAAAEGRRGDIAVCQGPPDRHRQSKLHLRITDSGDVLLGGTVESLLTGRLAL